MNESDDDSNRGSNSSPAPTAARLVREQRLPYAKPQLRVYGSVSKLTMGLGGSKADAGNKTKLTSERRLKENIVRVGDHPLGIGLYLFDYKPAFRDRWGHGRQFGVMADEVRAALPAAVSAGPDGFLKVDYSMLGVHRGAG